MRTVARMLYLVSAISVAAPIREERQPVSLFASCSFNGPEGPLSFAKWIYSFSWRNARRTTNKEISKRASLDVALHPANYWTVAGCLKPSRPPMSRGFPELRSVAVISWVQNCAGHYVTAEALANKNQVSRGNYNNSNNNNNWSRPQLEPRSSRSMPIAIMLGRLAGGPIGGRNSISFSTRALAVFWPLVASHLLMRSRPFQLYSGQPVSYYSSSAG